MLLVVHRDDELDVRRAVDDCAAEVGHKVEQLSAATDLLLPVLRGEVRHYRALHDARGVRTTSFEDGQVVGTRATKTTGNGSLTVEAVSNPRGVAQAPEVRL